MSKNGESLNSRINKGASGFVASRLGKLGYVLSNKFVWVLAHIRRPISDFTHARAHERGHTTHFFRYEITYLQIFSPHSYCKICPMLFPTEIFTATKSVSIASSLSTKAASSAIPSTAAVHTIVLSSVINIYIYLILFYHFQPAVTFPSPENHVFLYTRPQHAYTCDVYLDSALVMGHYKRKFWTLIYFRRLAMWLKFSWERNCVPQDRNESVTATLYYWKGLARHPTPHNNPNSYPDAQRQ
jgi:hypothetical protein